MIAVLLFFIGCIDVVNSCTVFVFSTFTPASESEIHKILSNYPNKQSDSDPIPTRLLKKCASVQCRRPHNH